MAPRLLIIAPSFYRSKGDTAVHQVRRRQVIPLNLPYLAALTPPDWEVHLMDEQIEPIDFSVPADLVAISTGTLSSLRAYDIADQFRRRGVTVIMGGPHTFFRAEEAVQHCDAVGIGEAESIWSRMLEDARHGRLQRFYREEVLPNLSGLPFPRYDLLDLRLYSPFRTYVVVSSRGCPFRCDFCSERYLLGEDYRCRPVPEVIEEIKRCGASNILFGDSNFAGRRTHSLQLMEALVPLKVRWSALWPAYLCDDEEFLDLARRSGLLHVNLGVESLDPHTLQGMNKRFNQVHKYDHILANLRRRGISYSLNFIFGWDGESESVFRSTLDFLREHRVPVAYFNILTPEKGTRLYDRLRAQDRLLHPEEIGRWPGQICYIKPPHGTPQELERNIRDMYRTFYSLPSMLSRLPLPVSRARLASWIINFSQRRMAHPRHDHNNFDNF